jgi:4-hydroxybenzoate polyprenyltransferase
MSTLITTTKNFYLYQKERFPIVVLGLSFLPAILSSGAVVAQGASITFVLIALIVSIAYLLHVRIIDEFRDYDHDLKHHKQRPISTGVISLKELKFIDLLTVIAVPLASLYSSMDALVIAVVMLLYSYFARKEFFLGLQFRKHFYLYNAVNLVQMLLLQILVYTLANPSFSFTALVTVHFLFTATGTIIFEFLRKVKSPGDDGTGKDTYTWFLGLDNALLIYAVFATMNILLFIKAMFLTETSITYWIPLSVALVVGTCSTLLINKLRKEEKTNQLMQLAFMLMYGAFNVLLFLAI